MGAALGIHPLIVRPAPFHSDTRDKAQRLLWRWLYGPARDGLRAVGVDPFKYDAWVPTIGVDFNKLPVIKPRGNRPKTRK
jgi:hypothetical protein